MTNKYIKNLTIFFIFYLSLILGFFYDENLNYGAYNDWVGAYLNPVKDFSQNFFSTLFNYDEYGQRHSPTYLIFLSTFLRFDFNLDQIRFLHLHLSLPLIYFFYKCLSLKFKNVKKIYLIVLSSVIFLSPTFRSLSIWPDSRLPGLMFFTITIYSFLKYQVSYSEKYAWHTSIFLIISSYISPNFSLFFPFFFYFFQKKLFIKKIIFLLVFNILASLPMLYYLFVLDINFLIAGKTPGIDGNTISLDFNISNKILIISTIIFFHLIPMFASKEHFSDLINFGKKKIIFIFPLSILLFYFFDYKIEFTGGGVFFNLSNFLFNNDYLFFLVAIIALISLIYLSSLHLSNLFIFSIMILSNVQNSIYHKYYEPLTLIVFFTLLQNVKAKKFLEKKLNLINIYILSVTYIIMRVFKNYFIL